MWAIENVEVIRGGESPLKRCQSFTGSSASIEDASFYTELIEPVLVSNPTIDAA